MAGQHVFICTHTPPAAQDFDYMAGQYVFICVPGVSRMEWHPFSLSTQPSDDTVMLHARVLGNWTKELHTLAAKASHGWTFSHTSPP